jgi:TP901 family phage tail tape measure protein
MPPVRIELIADIQRFLASMKRAESELDKFGAKTKTRSEALGALGQKLASGIVMTGAAVAVTSVKMAMDFQTSITRIQTGAGEAQANIKMIHDGILAMAGDVGQTPKALADGMYLIASAGYHGADGLKVLKAAAEGAAVGGSDMMTVADGLTTVLNNYGMGVDKATQATNGLIETVALGKTNLTDLSTSLAKVSPTGAALGLQFKDVAGAMATMTAQGYKADMAAERLNTMMMGLATPGAEATQILTTIGLSAQAVKDSMGKNGLAATISMIEDHLGKKIPKSSALYTDAMQQMMGGQTGYSAALLLSGSHMKTFEQNTNKIGETMDKSTKKVQGMADVQKTLKFQLDKLKGAGSSALIGLGEFFLPKLTKVAEWVSSVIDYMKKHPLIKTIASDAAIATFAVALAAKIKKAFDAVKGIFGAGAQSLNTKATTANTVALEENTAALLKKSGLPHKPSTTTRVVKTVVKDAVKSTVKKVVKSVVKGAAGEAIGVVAGAAEYAQLLSNVALLTAGGSKQVLKDKQRTHVTQGVGAPSMLSAPMTTGQTSRAFQADPITEMSFGAGKVKTAFNVTMNQAQAAYAYVKAQGLNPNKTGAGQTMLYKALANFAKNDVKGKYSVTVSIK